MGDQYGTVAKLRVKPGHLEEVLKVQEERHWAKGAVAWYHYQMDDDPNELYVAAVFKDKASYLDNANRPESHQEYLKLLEHLESDPEWHDGKIVLTRT